LNMKKHQFDLQRKAVHTCFLQQQFYSIMLWETNISCWCNSCWWDIL
jgi:hypothetical protein